MDDLKFEIKTHMIRELNLEGIQPEDINNSAPLFGDGLGLDSIDALELVVLLEKYYNIKIVDEAVGKMAFQSIDSMAAFVQEQKGQTT